MFNKIISGLLLSLVIAAFPSLQAQDTITVIPEEYPGALSNPLKGFRPNRGSSSQYDYPTLVRDYIKWNEIENNASDGVDKIISFCNSRWAGLENSNIKVIPRVYLDWDSNAGNEYWPSDLKNGDWYSDEFKDRVVKMIDKLGKAWDNDPRVAWVQTGIIGFWGEQENPVGVDDDGWAERMGKAFEEAFPNKLLLVRNQDVWETEGYEFGVYWDSFAHPGQASGSWTRIRNANANGRYLTQVVEGEVAYNWGQDVLYPVIGSNPDETLRTPNYYNYLIDVIKELHCSALGWIANYNPNDPNNTVGAMEVQKAFGYRFVINQFSCSKRADQGAMLNISFKVKNTGSTPFYEKWPLAFVLIDESTKQIVWKKELSEFDIRTWLPGDNYNYSTRTYATPANEYEVKASVTVPSNITTGQYMAGVTILEPYSQTPGVFFAVKNFLKESQTQPLCRVGIGQDVVGSHEVNSALFSDPVKDDDRYYTLEWNGVKYNLTTSAATGGSISPGSSVLNKNQKVLLRATAQLGYVFSGWSGDLSGIENPVIITMDSDKSVTANFASVSTYTLTVNAPNADVELTPAGGVYNTGTVVTIKVIPKLGYIFSGWSGDLTGTTNPATITMNSNKTVTATLTSAPVYTLTTNASGGSITLDPAGPQYTKGTVVKITAIANPGFTFSYWSGDPLNDEFYINPNYVTMNSDKNITAIFFGSPVDTTGLWVETFDFPDGTTSDTGSTAWTATRPSGIFGIIGNRLAISGAGPEGVFSTSQIDISGGSVDLSVMVEGAGGLDPVTSANKDYFGIFIKVDGGSEILVYEIYGAQPAISVTKNNIIGKTLEIIIKGYTTAGDEFYYFDNLRVAYTYVSLIKNGDFTFELNNWTPQVISPAQATISVVDKECQVVISAVSTQEWHINILQSGILLETNTSYTLSFNARATNNKTITAKAQFDHDPWTSSIEQPVTISNEMQNYSVTWLQDKPADYYKVGLFFGSDTIDVWVDNLRLTTNPTDVNDKAETILPEYTLLGQNYPNPFNPITTINYQLNISGHVSLNIYNIMGEFVKTLVDIDQNQGSYNILWDGKDLNGNSVSSGMYIYVLKTNDKVFSHKMILLK